MKNKEIINAKVTYKDGSQSTINVYDGEAEVEKTELWETESELNDFVLEFLHNEAPETLDKWRTQADIIDLDYFWGSEKVMSSTLMY